MAAAVAFALGRAGLASASAMRPRYRWQRRSVLEGSMLHRAPATIRRSPWPPSGRGLEVELAGICGGDGGRPELRRVAAHGAFLSCDAIASFRFAAAGSPEARAVAAGRLGDRDRRLELRRAVDWRPLGAGLPATDSSPGSRTERRPASASALGCSRAVS